MIHAIIQCQYVERLFFYHGLLRAAHIPFQYDYEYDGYNSMTRSRMSMTIDIDNDIDNKFSVHTVELFP